jgi:hypothetical protein
MPGVSPHGPRRKRKGSKVGPYAQSKCLTYVAGTKVSANGHNWTCGNGNCASCASCAPGGSDCPWGVVWSDNGACQ